MTELKQLRDFAEQLNGIRPQERSLKGVVNNLIQNYNPEIVVNPELEENEKFLLGFQNGNTKYEVNNNVLNAFAFLNHTTDDNVYTLYFFATILLNILPKGNIGNTIDNIKCIIKNETDNEIITTKNITSVSKALTMGKVDILKDRLQDNTRYVYSSLNLHNGDEYLYSEKLISATFSLDFSTNIIPLKEGFNNDKEFIFTYTSKIYYQLPVIPNPNEVENNAKGGTRSTKVESTPIVEVDSVDLDNDEK